MSDPLKSKIEALLDTIPDPKSGKGLMSAGLVQALTVLDDKAGFVIEVSPDDVATYKATRDAAEQALRAEGFTKVQVILTSETDAVEKPRHAGLSQRAKSDGRPPAPVATSRPAHVKRVIVVGSGKGGVGKSTLSLNLAIGLKAQGLKVGLLDADIYGPSVPIMTGHQAPPKTDADKNMIPHEAFGLKVNSIGYLVSPEQAMIWRAPMATQAISQLLLQTRWGSLLSPLDVLVIDLPPGTGDIQLTLTQKTVIDGAVVVSTPQDMALADARRAVTLFEKTGLKVLGVIENMAYFKTPDGQEVEIFGRGGAKQMAQELSVAFLGEVPLEPALRAATDKAEPLNTKTALDGVFFNMAKQIKKTLFDKGC